METTRLTALAGGIGAGKSVVSRILRLLGYEVYDSDTEARRIMSGSDNVRVQLLETFGNEIFEGKKLVRERLASIVFSDEKRLAALNGIVHRAVVDDVERWRKSSTADRVFVESAIVHSSGLVGIVDDVWYVTADEATRIERVMERNSMEMSAVVARIRAQDKEAEATSDYGADIIVNDGVSPVLPRIHELLGK